MWWQCEALARRQTYRGDARLFCPSLIGWKSCLSAPWLVALRFLLCRAFSSSFSSSSTYTHSRHGLLWCSRVAFAAIRARATLLCVGERENVRRSWISGGHTLGEDYLLTDGRYILIYNNKALVLCIRLDTGICTVESPGSDGSKPQQMPETRTGMRAATCPFLPIKNNLRNAIAPSTWWVSIFLSAIPHYS